MVGCLKIAAFAYAHWFFGNLYEAVARVPDHLAAKDDDAARDDRLPTIVSRGSPVRYYLPGIPVVIGGTLCALSAGRASRREQLWLAALAASVLTGLAVTLYAVPSINRRLFVRGQRLTSAERQRLLKSWYRLNGVRLVGIGSAWLIAARLIRQA